MPSEPGKHVPNVAKIAVLRANAIGDFIVAIPALDALRTAYPDAHITCLGARWHVELLTARPAPWDCVVEVPPCPGVREPADGEAVDPARLAEFLAAQRSVGYDIAVQLHGGGAHSNGFVTALGARVSIGSRDGDAPPLDRTVPYTAYQHETFRFLEVVRLVGAAPTTLEPVIAVTERDRAEADEVLNGRLDGRPLVVVHPGATDPRRRWPAANFAAVADALARRGAEIAIVGTDQDAVAAGEIAAMTAGPVIDLTGRVRLGALIGVLERATLLVGNDSGPRHLAAAVGTATVAVYWVANAMNHGPLMRARHRIAVSFRTACPTCGADQLDQRCGHEESFVASVPVDDVIRHALDVYDTEVVAWGA